ncbi:MAG TPA: hypothetical protein VMB02_15640 [Candidatus Aquilonibacter sp.]|nr:hypothetical protein [Candidatus Aquilonibacter sp.]
MLTFSSGARFDPRRFRPRSWTQKYHVQIGLALFLIGLAVVWAALFFRIGGGLGFAIRAFGALALLFSGAFQLNHAPVFPPSPVTSANRWKYLALLAILCLIILPIAWWVAARALGK